MKKIDRSKRLIATVTDVKYITDETAEIIVCVILSNIHFRNTHLGSIKIDGISVCVDNNFDIKFGKTLARAKAELAMYKEIKNKCLKNIKTFTENCIEQGPFTKSHIEKLEIQTNTIIFAESMIKHQVNYINKLIRTQYPNE